MTPRPFLLMTPVVLAWLAMTGPSFAQEPDASRNAGSDRPFEISDNSFLVEEALNQEAGIFQNIFNIRIIDRENWQSTFTQEWPVRSQTHQISYTVPYSAVGGQPGVGDALVHYRIAIFKGDDARPAFSPRVSLIVPSGSASRGLGNGHAGWEVNLPFSKQVRDVYFHWNGGFTHFPAARVEGGDASLLTPRVAGSAIWRARPMLNLMLETVVEWPESAVLDARGWSRVVTVVPGFRTGWDIGKAQTIVGFGVPVMTQNGATSTGVLFYFSHELPFD